MKAKQDNPDELNEPTVSYNLDISFSTPQQLEEEEIMYTKLLNAEQRFEYLHQLRKATHNLDLTEEEKKILLNIITINPPDEY